MCTCSPVRRLRIQANGLSLDLAPFSSRLEGMAALVLDDMSALNEREQGSASGIVTKFSGEPLEDDVGTLHPVGGTA